MERCFAWSAGHPRAALALSALISLAFGTGIVRLEIDGSLEPLMGGKDERFAYLRDANENLGARSQLVVLVRSPHLFEPEMLAATKRFVGELGSLPGVERAASLFDVRVPVLHGGVAYAEPSRRDLPREPEAAEAWREELLGNLVLREHFLNGAGDALAVLLLLSSESAGGVGHAETVGEIGRLRSRALEGMAEGTEIIMLGVPLVKAAIWGRIAWDLAVLGPVALLVIAGLVQIFYRSVAAVCLPACTGAASALATLGFMGHFGFTVNALLSIILVLVLVLGSTEDLHLLSEFQRGLRQGLGKAEAIAAAGRTAGRALFLTAATTALGFLSLAPTDIEGLRGFAFCCAFGMAANFLVTVLAGPALLMLLPAPRAAARLGIGRAPGWIGFAASPRRDALTALAFLLFLAFAAFGIGRVVIGSDYFDFASRRSEVYRAKQDFPAYFGATSLFVVVMETGSYDGVFKEENLGALLRLHEFLEEEGGPALGWASFFNEFRRVGGEPPATSADPPSAEELRAFAEVFPPSVLRDFLDFDRSRAVIRVKAVAPSSRDTVLFESRLRDFAESSLPEGIEVRLTGEKAVVDQLSDFVTRKLFGNLVLLCAVTAALLSLFVGSWRQGLLSLVPNLVPVAAIYGAMGWLGIPLGLGTCPVALVAFSVAVDDTIHFLLRYNHERSEGADNGAAVAATLRHEWHPVAATSTVVGGGFLVLMTSPAPVNGQLGALFFVGTVAALAADLLLTPVLLRRFPRR